jgi:hypothetical protein
MSNEVKLFMPNEQVVKVVWPSIAAWPLGCWIGRVWGNALAKGPVAACCAGFLLAPLAALVYLWRLRPRRCRRYIVTNERILIVEGLLPRVVGEVSWSEVTQMETVPRPGQAALRAGDVEVYSSDRVLLRLAGVSLVENFVRLCRRTQKAALMVPSNPRRPVP